MDKAVRRYLQAHLRPEAEAWNEWALGLGIESGRWAWALALPLRGEDISALECVAPPRESSRRGLVIAVVNGQAGGPFAKANEAWLTKAETLGDAWGAPLTLADAQLGMRRCENYDLLVVDRARPGRTLPPKRGVGTARKIGLDLAWVASVHGWLRSRWLHTSDADARLPAGLFEAVEGVESEAVAHVAAFRHRPGALREVSAATEAYEWSLRYYVLGLAFAGSLHASHTIGSLLAVDSRAYARVRGVPEREAGEDFYLLNKLRKLGPVATGEGGRVSIQSRLSTRVPFGTGPAVSRIVETGAPLQVYHPSCFEGLREFLEALCRVGAGEPPTEVIASLGPTVRRALDRLGYPARLERLVAQYPAKSLGARLAENFDALTALRLIHTLRDTGCGTLPLRDAGAKADFVGAHASCFELAALEQKRCPPLLERPYRLVLSPS